MTVFSFPFFLLTRWYFLSIVGLTQELIFIFYHFRWGSYLQNTMSHVPKLQQFKAQSSKNQQNSFWVRQTKTIPLSTAIMMNELKKSMKDTFWVKWFLYMCNSVAAESSTLFLVFGSLANPENTSTLRKLTRGGHMMSFRSNGAAICPPMFTTPETCLLFCEMSKAVHLKFVMEKRYPSLMRRT